MGFCKFNKWCKFLHKDDKKCYEKVEGLKQLEDRLKTVEDVVEKNCEKVLKLNDEVKDMNKLEDRLKAVEIDIEKKSEKVSKLENELKDMCLKVIEKDQTISKINKKFNVLKEKVTLLFDLEGKYDTLEKKIDEIVKPPLEEDIKATESQSVPKESSETCSNDSEENKCPACDFTAKNKFGLKVHFHKKHSMARFRCFACDFTCENKIELNEHNEKYYYSHRQVLNKNNEKAILDEIQQLDEDGYLFHRAVNW